MHYRRPSRVLPEELRKAFACYAWPGNIRELENMIRRFVLLPDLDLALADLQVAREPNAHSSADQPHSLREVSALATERAERELVLRTLEQVKWNRKQAARELHICYKSLLNKLRRLANSQPLTSENGEFRGTCGRCPLRRFLRGGPAKP
jgi:two-component system response regulator AtoC